MNTYQHGRADGVVAVDEGVEDGLAQGGIGHGVAFDALDALKGDGGLEVFGADEINRLRHLGEEIAVQGVVVGKIGFGTEEADFHEGTRDVFLGIEDDLQSGQAVFFACLYGDEDAQEVANFVGDVFQQLRGIRQLDDFALVIASDVQFAALGIRKTAGPAQEFIPPGLFPFELLVFLHACTRRW